MRSILLSLLAYFLILLGLALGAVALLVYELTQKSLQDTLREEQKVMLDDELLRQAQNLASLTQSPWGRNRYQALYSLGLLTAGVSPQGHLLMPVWAAEVLDNSLADRLHQTTVLHIVSDYDRYHDYYPLGVLTAGLNPNGQVLMPLWLVEAADGPLAYRLRFTSPVRAVFADDVLPGSGEGQDVEYCQITSASGLIWQKSRSLGDQAFTMDRKTVNRLGLSAWSYDETRLSSGSNVRRITYKTNLPPFAVAPPWGGRGSSRRPGSRPGPAPYLPRRTPERNLPAIDPERLPPGRVPLGGLAPRQSADRGLPPPLIPRNGSDRSSPVFFIQCAIDTAQVEKAIEDLNADRHDELVRHRQEADDMLASLRNRLLWIILVTFAATMGGGFLLVRLGLSPLRRLSDAVSRVSTKDFRLPLDDARLPLELQPIADRLNHTLKMLKRAFAREKQAAADISHDLRTPLAALLTTIEVALRRPRSPEEYREMLEGCLASGQQMSQLVERLLALARLDAGADVLRPRQIDAAVLAEQCADLVRPLAEAHSIHLCVHPGPAAHLHTDPDKLREILTNLLHNAIQYNRPEGTIDVDIERQNGHLVLAVRDTGIGIAPEASTHIFERFYRADPARQADGLHAGIGLAIVKGYIDLLGGTISVDSTPGQGSTFRVQLPDCAEPHGGRG